jgi:hypothetical protein
MSKRFLSKAEEECFGMRGVREGYVTGEIL